MGVWNACEQEDGREALGGTGLHLSGSSSSSHAKLLSMPWCWQEGKRGENVGVVDRNLRDRWGAAAYSPSSLAHLGEGKDKFKAEARMNSGQPRSG